MSTALQAFRSLQSRARTWNAQMDWMRGLRAATALCVPLLVGDLFGIANLGWVGLGGYEAILADTGGPYRMRLQSLLTLGIGGGLGVLLGSLVGGNLAWALPVTMIWCFAWSYLTVLGQPFTSAGLLVQVMYICGVGAPASQVRTAATLGLLLLAGALWASVLSLFLWPLDPYRPARLALAACYDELSSFLGSILELAARSDQKSSLWHRLAQHHQYRIRETVERGWGTVAHVRAEQWSETAQLHHLIVLLETADLLIARTIALAEHLEGLAREQNSSVCLERGLATLGSLRQAESSVADLLARRHVSGSHAEALRHLLQELPRTMEECMGQVDASGRFLLTQGVQAVGLVDTALESVGLLRLGTTARSDRFAGYSTGHLGYVYERLGEMRRGWDFDLLVASFTRESLVLRHAVRAALVCGADVGIILLLHINHGYWLLMTSLIVLQPHVSGTLRRGIQRIGGTVAGGVVAALLAMGLHSQGTTAAVLFPFALLSLAVLPINYAAFVFFLTPTFVLAWMPFAGDWQLAMVRVANTFAGALLAVLAMLFLFPSYERQRTPDYLRASVAANRSYLAELIAAWQTRNRSSRVLASARRRTGLAHNATEESLERTLNESWRRKPAGQFATTFAIYLRRFAQGITLLTTLEGENDWKQSPQVQGRLQRLSAQLSWLEQALASTDPGESVWPETPAQVAASEQAGDRQLTRLERQSNVLREQLLSLRAHGWLSS